MFNFEANGIQFRIRPYYPFVEGVELIVYLEELSGASWIKLAYPSIYKEDLIDEASAYQALEVALVEIQQALDIRLGDSEEPKPDIGLEFIEWLISNKLEFVDGKIQIKN